MTGFDPAAFRAELRREAFPGRPRPLVPAAGRSDTMPSVTLSWDDPEGAAEFLRLRAELRRQGWLPDTSAAALQELVEGSDVRESGS